MTLKATAGEAECSGGQLAIPSTRGLAREDETDDRRGKLLRPGCYRTHFAAGLARPSVEETDKSLFHSILSTTDLTESTCFRL